MPVEPTVAAAAPVEPTFVAAAPVEPAPVEPTAPRPFALDLAPDDTTARCPKLGFADDPDNSVGRPTRLHRCFAAGAPLPLSLDQQRELCLSDQFGTCPRLTMGAFVPPARDEQATWGGPATRRPGTRRAEPEGDDSRIVRLPFVARANAAERGAVSDRQAVGGSEPTRFRPAGGPVRDGASTPPTPLRARIERSTSLGSTGAVAEPAASATPEARTKESKSVRQTLMDDPAERRLGGIPVGLIAGVVVVLAILGVIGYLLTPYLGDLLVDESVDPSLLPNTSAVAAGTPIAQVTSARVTPVTGATVGTDPGAAPSDAASTKPAPGAASASSAATAAPAPTLLPEPAQAAPAKAAVAAAQPAGNTLLDERFTSNDRNWPSSAQGPAFLINGSYRMMTRQAAQFVAVGAPIADVLQDVVVNATFHKLNGPSGGGYGIIVRDQAPAPQNGTSQDGHYYVLEVGDTGEVGMWRRDGDHWVDLLPWQPNPAVKAGNATNELSVRAVGDRLSLSVNGTQVATRTDTTFSSGSVGLFVGGDGNQVAVDHFSIQTP